ncbi:hypothetical protein SISNIDRAFT_143394 [Sistotremastrum niveocremeum HHB9708]|uniref:Uncharacterized protein n=1 Tax=Sistotremastrum niveocremeum HHB9708 TaxID=1314777 RepID=A0A165A3E7_9AGAM|nr:hypothetical protein SISNIDRAFT_143394 [Sistotremastrum niveocremeum HHB9708]
MSLKMYHLVLIHQQSPTRFVTLLAMAPYQTVDHLNIYHGKTLPCTVVRDRSRVLRIHHRNVEVTHSRFMAAEAGFFGRMGPRSDLIIVSLLTLALAWQFSAIVRISCSTVYLLIDRGMIITRFEREILKTQSCL